MRRKITKRLLLIVIGLIIAASAALFFFHLPFVKSAILASIQGNLEKNQGILLTVDSFDYNLFKRTVSVEGLLLAKSGRKDLPPLLQASSAHGTIPLSIIFNRKLEIENVKVTNPVISIVIDQMGENNLPGGPGSPESGRDQLELPDFIIRQAGIENGRMHYLDESRDLEILVPGIWLRGSWAGEGRHAVNMETRLPGSVRLKQQSFPLEHVDLRAEIFKEGIDFEKLFLNLAGSDLTFVGSLNGFSFLDFKGTCEGLLPLDAAAAVFNAPGDRLSGSVQLRAELSGPLRDLSAVIHLTGSGLAYEAWEDIRLNSEISWQKEALRIQSLDLDDGKGEIHARGSLYPLDWSRGSSLALEWQGLDLEPVGNALGSPLAVSSVSMGNLEVSWTGFSLGEITGKGEIRFNGSVGNKRSNGRAAVSGKILAQADIKGLHAEFLDVSILGALLRGDFRLVSDEISGSYQVETPSVAGVMPAVQAFASNLDDRLIREAGLDGPVSVSGQVTGTLKKPVVTFDVLGDDLEFLNVKNIGVRGNIVYSDRSLGIESLQILDRKGKLSIKGAYPLGPPKRTMHFEAEGEDLPLERVLYILGSQLEATGTASVSAQIDGTLESPEILFRGLLSEGSVYGQSVERLEFSGDYRNRKIVLDNVSARRLSGVLEGNGFYDPAGREFSLNLKSEAFPVRGLILPGTGETVSAGVDFELSARGTIDSPEISSKGKLSEVFIGPRDLGNLDFEVETRDKEVLFRVDSSLYSSSIEGTFSLLAPRILRMEGASSLMPLDIVREKILLFEEYDFSGTMTARASLEMDVDKEENRIEARVEIEQLELNKGELGIRNKGPIEAAYSGGVFHLEQMLLTGEGTEIEASGILSPLDSGSSELTAKAEVDLAVLKEFFPGLESAGSLRIESDFRGALRSPVISAKLEISGAEVQHPSLPVFLEGIESSLSIRENVIRIDSLTLSLDDSRFEVKGNIPLEALPLELPEFLGVHGEREAELSLIFQDFDPAVLALIHSRELAQSLSGRLSGEMELRGRQLLPDKISGKAGFETFELIITGIPLKQEEETLVQLEQGTLSVQRLVLVEGDNRVGLSGTAEIAGDGRIDLLLQGEFGLGRLRKLDRKSVFSGKTLFEMRIGESLANPSIQGFLDIQDGRMRRSDPAIFLEQFNGRIKFLQDRVEIDGITGVLNGGRLVVNGKAGFKAMEFHDVALNLRAVNSAIEFPDGLRSVVSGDFRLTSREEDYLLAGAVLVIDSRYTDDFNVGSSLSRIFRKDAARDLFQESSPYLKQLSLNVSLRTQKNLIIDNNIAKSQATANIKLSGTADRPSLAGRMNLADGGELFFSQNTFTIDRGTVDFVNPTRIEPDLNLSASTKVKEYNITLVLQGVPEKLTAAWSLIRRCLSRT